MIGPYGDLKAQAKQPGPGSYNTPVAASQIGTKFGSAQRAMTKDYAETMNWAAAVNKARSLAHARHRETGARHDDSLLLDGEQARADAPRRLLRPEVRPRSARLSIATPE